ncbi:MAG TPA: response regulator [Chloroflexota bacterium]|nr:response regulator [Chloroflexota bacterium]
MEDQLEISELLSDVLQPLGFQTFVARDGSEATNLVRALKPDVITLDLNLPLKDGRMVLRELAEDPATKHIPVVIISACSGGLTPNGQVVEVLSKPFELADLIGAVMAVVEHRTP